MENLILHGGAKVPDKAERAEIVKDTIQKAKDGEIDALALLVKCKALFKIIDEIMKSEELYSLATTALSEYPELKHGGVKLYGAKIEQVPERKYNYKTDPKWIELEQKIEAASAELIAEQKKREEYLKRIPMGTSILDESTGEILAASAIIYDGEMLKFTL